MESVTISENFCLVLQGRVNYFEFPPRQELSHIVDRYWSMDNTGSAAGINREHVVADDSVEVFFNFGDGYTRCEPASDPVRVNGSHVVGFRRCPILVSQSGTVSIFGIRFRPEGFARLVRFPLSDVSQMVVDIRDLFGPEATLIEERLFESDGPMARVRCIEDILLQRTRAAGAAPGLAGSAVDLIRKARGNLAISALCSRLGVGYKRLERAFGDEIGVGPKLYTQIVRFKSAAAHLTSNPGAPDTFPEGYFDQPHFIREFKRFAGLTPREFRERRENISSFLLNTDAVSNLYNTTDARR